MTRSLVLLSSHPHLHTPSRLADEANRLGWKVEILIPRRRFLRASAASTPAAPSTDEHRTILARAGPFTLRDVLCAHRECTSSGATALQSRRSLVVACDKWLTLAALKRARVLAPVSILVRDARRIGVALASVPGPPWFLKTRRGSQGTHVLLARSPSEAHRQIRLLWGLGFSVILQEDLRGRGAVRRHLIAGDRVIATAIGTPAAGEYRTNWHRGGTWRIDPTPPTSDAVAIAATRAVGLPFAGVDSIGDEPPAILEVNASPGVEGLEAASGRNLTRELLLRILSPP